jgi:hypothetical protein
MHTTAVLMFAPYARQASRESRLCRVEVCLFAGFCVWQRSSGPRH